MTIPTRPIQARIAVPRRAGSFFGLSRMVAAAALASVALGVGAQTAVAYGTTLACAPRAGAAVLAPWGDTATYFLVSNGGFENGSTDWALAGGARVVDGNETYHVAGAGDSHSLTIPPSGSAESRAFCVSKGEDVIRLFVNNLHVSGAVLHVDAIVVNPDNGSVGTAAFDVNGDVQSAPWAPTIALRIPNMLGGSGTEQLTLRFTLRGTQTTWNIDDVFVDPFKSW
jgi:hypothetical protein